jgi:hypothetical protein
MSRALLVILVFAAACATHGAPEPTAEAIDRRAGLPPTASSDTGSGECDEAELEGQWERIAREHGMELVRSGNELVASRGPEGRQLVLHRADDDCRYAIRDVDGSQRDRLLGLLQGFPPSITGPR